MKLQRVFKAGAIGLLALAALTATAAADISRSCRGTITISTAGGTSVRNSFTIPVTVPNRAYANRARERSRDAMLSCVREHWNMRMSSNRPHWCNNGGDYPYQAFSQEMTAAICAANPGRQTFLVNVGLDITGKKGCEHPDASARNNVWGAYTIARDYRVWCWLDPEPEVRQGWNLPGRDYRYYNMPAGATADDCAEDCASDSRCEAWTYKHPAEGNPPMCFLKDSVPDWNRDARFVSGIKGTVLY